MTAVLDLDQEAEHLRNRIARLIDSISETSSHMEIERVRAEAEYLMDRLGQVEEKLAARDAAARKPAEASA